jgi:hypothetical protein
MQRRGPLVALRRVASRRVASPTTRVCNLHTPMEIMVVVGTRQALTRRHWPVRVTGWGVAGHVTWRR